MEDLRSHSGGGAMLAKTSTAVLLVLLLNASGRADNSPQQIATADVGVCVKLDPLSILRKHGHVRIGKIDNRAKVAADGAFSEVVIKGLDQFGGAGRVIYAEKMSLEIEEPKRKVRFLFFNKLEQRLNNAITLHGEGKGLVLTYEITLPSLEAVK
jgi:hypothetical protein